MVMITQTYRPSPITPRAHVACSVCGKEWGTVRATLSHSLAEVWKMHPWYRGTQGEHVCDGCWDGTKEAA